MTTGRINQIAIDEKGAPLSLRERALSIESSERAVETAPTREGGSHRSTLINGHRETWNRSEATEESK